MLDWTILNCRQGGSQGRWCDRELGRLNSETRARSTQSSSSYRHNKHEQSLRKGHEGQFVHCYYNYQTNRYIHFPAPKCTFHANIEWLITEKVVLHFLINSSKRGSPKRNWLLLHLMILKGSLTIKSKFFPGVCFWNNCGIMRCSMVPKFSQRFVSI